MAETAVIETPRAGAEPATTVTASAVSPTAGTSQPTDDQILGIHEESQPDRKGRSQSTQPGMEVPEVGENNDKTQPNDAAPGQEQAQRRWTPEVRDFFKKHPDLRDAYFRAQEYTKLFPDFKTAEYVANHLGQYENPAELIQDLRGVADLRAIDRMFYSGDPIQQGKIVENLFTDSPKAFASLLQSLPQTLERLATDISRPDLARQAQKIHSENNARAFERMLEWNYRKATSEGNAELGQKLEDVAKAVLGRAPWAPESVETRLADLKAEQQRIDSQRQQARVEAATRWVNEANEQVVHEFTNVVKQTVEQLVGKTYTDEAKRLLIGEIYRRIHQSLEGNHDLVDHIHALTRGGVGDPRAQRQIVRLVSTQAKRMIPSVAEKVIGAFGQGTLAATEQKQRRQTTAAGRADVTGSSGMDVRSIKATTPAQLQKSGRYRHLSDDDILDGQV